jgi:hypothetical protein
MHEEEVTINDTEITIIRDSDGIVTISECPGCGGNGMDVELPEKPGEPFSCRICGYKFHLS